MTKESHTYGYSDDLSLLEYEEDPEFYEWYSTEGSKHIKEISTQLRSFLNYKYNVIRLRYSNSQELHNIPKKEEYEKEKEKFTSKSFEYLSIINKLGLKRKRLGVNLLIIIEKIKKETNKSVLNLLKDMKHLGSEIWRIISSLSNYEIYRDPRLMKIIIEFASILCDAHSVFSSLLSRFYEELNLSFEQIETELSGLLLYNKEHQPKADKKEKRVKILE